MTLYEVIYSTLTPLMPALTMIVRSRLRQTLRKYPAGISLLDVGGRKSPYTIGMPVSVTILDMPRENEIQLKANLGVNPEILNKLSSTRSNIKKVILEDMTCTTLPDNCFEGVLSIEVIEHVEKCALFVEQIHRVLKPGGFIIITTPNADHPARAEVMDNKDHHFFKRKELQDLLETYFQSVEVIYAIPVGKYFSMSLKGWSPARPLQTLKSMFASMVNRVQSRNPVVKSQAIGTRQLIAVAFKSVN
jgi:SAM-dependent methyltransferase